MISLNLKLAPVPYATPKWLIHQDFAELGCIHFSTCRWGISLGSIFVSYTGGTGVMLVVNGENLWHLALSDSPVT